MRKLLRAPLAIIVLISAVFVGVYFTLPMAASGNDDKPTETPLSLVGEWHQPKSEIDGVMFKASISKGAIQINMVTRDSTSIYWLGTFDAEKSSSDPFETVSIADSDAMAQSIFGSQDKTKRFTYRDGELSYEFTMMGTTSTVRLVKL